MPKGVPMNSVANALLWLHICAGTVALLTAVVALLTAKGGVNHVRAGRVYALAMTLVFLTAVPLAMLGADIFLLLIAFFSFYLVFAGWRFAKNYSGSAQPVDWIAIAVMALTALLMWFYAAYIGMQGSSQWVTLAIFGAIALALSVVDARYYRAATTPRVQRIQRHLTNMLAGTIATVTAVLVVNVSVEPEWIPWILPTIVITPLIVWWNIRVARQSERRRNA